MTEGYIKLHRNLLENPVTQEPEMAWLWCVLLLSTNHKDIKKIWNGKSIIIKEGSFITGRKILAKKTGLSENKIYRYLNYFENEQQIKQQKNNKFTVITILNWQKYQGNGTTNRQQNKQPVDNKSTTNRQQIDTNKNDKNVKNDKNKEIYAEFVSMTLEEYQKLIDKYGEANTKRFIDKLSIWKGASGKTKTPGSDYLKILNWVVEAVLGEGKKKEIDNQIQQARKAEDKWNGIKEKRSDTVPDNINDKILKILK